MTDMLLFRCYFRLFCIWSNFWISSSFFI